MPTQAELFFSKEMCVETHFQIFNARGMSLENFQGQKLGSQNPGNPKIKNPAQTPQPRKKSPKPPAAQFLTLKILQGHAAFVENLKKSPKELFF